MKRFLTISLAAAAACIGSLVYADYPIIDGASATRTIFAFTCQTTKICSAHTPMKSDGTELFTVAAPGFVSVTNANANGQATAANSSPVVQAGFPYEMVAASQTAQILGGAGATGDYLSHCVVYPATTTPGVVQVFDNTNTAGTLRVIDFVGGASSVSNLVPFAVPVGMLSATGGWKVTTGANVSVVCVGRFT
jgi:hypothetical protein